VGYAHQGLLGVTRPPPGRARALRRRWRSGARNAKAPLDGGALQW